MSQAQSILLESGTNELEIVTYTVGENLFSINVMKVREIINPFPVTTVPESHHAVEGVVQVRGEILPVINLATALNIKSTKPLDQTKFIISELNQMKVIFRVDEVHRIQRISWEQIDEPASLSMGLEETTSGIVKLDGKIILLLDYEKIVCEISNGGYDKKTLSGLAQKQIVLKNYLYCGRFCNASSNTRRNIIISWIFKMNFFSNGAEALAHIEKLEKSKEKNV